MNDSIFEVTRDEYKGFVDEIKQDCRRVEVVQIDKKHTAAKIYSKKTGKCLCSRVAYSAETGDPDPEKYYIFEMPDNDERKAPTPIRKIVLETKEQVQAFFDFLARKNKETKND